MERKIDEWAESQNHISLEQTDRTDPPPPPARTEHVNSVFIGSGKSDDSSKIQKDPPPPIIINNKIKKDEPIKTSKNGYYMVKINEYPFRNLVELACSSSTFPDFNPSKEVALKHELSSEQSQQGDGNEVSNIQSDTLEYFAMTNENPSSVNIKQHCGNPDSRTALEYQRNSLASLDVSVLDKPHFKLENLSRRLIHESDPNDAGVEEKIGSSMHEASNATKNDGIQLGKDGKPLHNPKGGPIKPILKTGKVTVAGESIIASKSGPMQQGSFIVEPSLSTSNEPSTQGSMADLFKSNQQRNKKIIKVSHITTFEEINGADVAIPKAVVDEVREHFSNTLYGYFIGKRIPFLIMEKYVLNTWAKYGIERAIIRNGFYLFKFKTKEGMEQVMEHGPWTIRLSPLILNIWKPNTKLVKEEVASIPVWVKLHKVPIVAYSESSYARALIEMTSDWAFVESLVVGIPLEDGLGHSMETIEVEYEWKPPYCGVCKTFGHTLSTCPKRTTETTNSGNKNTIKSDSKSVSTADEEGFVEVSNRKKKWKNHGKSTRIDGIKFTKPKASFYQEKKGPKSTTNQSKASTSSSIPGKNSTSVSNSFDTLCNLEEEGVNDPKGKNEGMSQSGFSETSKGPSDTYYSPNVTMAGGTRVSKATKVPSTPFPKSARPECINESDIDEDDIESYNGPLFGGGNQLEDEDFDFSDGYEDQVFDLPGQLKELRDFRLSMSSRK
ncbi:zinc knuckle CX2CX4HX4C containing protein [Tanacetum coccineum]